MEKVESPARVHIFYIDYGNVSTWPLHGGTAASWAAAGTFTTPAAWLSRASGRAACLQHDQTWAL